LGYEFKERKMSNEKGWEPKETVKDVLELPIRAIPERGLTLETCTVFQVRVALDQSDGKTITAVYFPYYNQKDEITGFKKRNLLLDKSEKGHFTAIGSVGVTSKLWGQSVAEKINRKRSNLVYVEGEFCAMSAYQALVDSVKGTKFEDLKPFVVSLSCGTANAVEATLHNEDFCRSFERLTLAFDGDHATPTEKDKGIKRGAEAMEDVAGALIGDNLYCVQFAPGMKDHSDYVQAGRSAELAKLLQFGAKRYVTEKIAFAADVEFEELIAPRKVGLMTPSFPKLMEKIEGWRLRELTLLFSMVGTGKSTVTANLAADWNAAGERVGLIFLEEELKETLQRMVAHRLKVNYNKFKKDPLSCATREQIKEAYDYMNDGQKIVMLKHFGNLPINELMNKVRHMHLVCGCRYIVIDHLTLCVSGGEKEVDERKNLDRVMTELGAFCASNDVHILAVSHINRSGVDMKPPKDGKDGPEPYWITLNTSALRGSAALEQLSWTILALESQIMPDRSRGHVRLVCVKNRPTGRLGTADTFKLNEDTGAVELYEDEVTSF
jgi:hypothetical protein